MFNLLGAPQSHLRILIKEAVRFYLDNLSFIETHIRTMVNRKAIKDWYPVKGFFDIGYGEFTALDGYLLTQHCVFAGQSFDRTRYKQLDNMLTEIRKLMSWELSIIVPANSEIGIITPETNAVLVLPVTIEEDPDDPKTLPYAFGWVRVALGGLPDGTYVKYWTYTFIIKNGQLSLIQKW